jgi:hypothetical protein
VIFYAIYKRQGNGKHYWSYPFAMRTLERIVALQCGTWGAAAGAAGQIPAGTPPVLAGEGPGRGLGTSGGRFGHLAGTGVAPASGAPADGQGSAGRRAVRPVRRRAGAKTYGGATS